MATRSALVTEDVDRSMSVGFPCPDWGCFPYCFSVRTTKSPSSDAQETS
ncbi:hypothetical protein A2U01_0119240, partial [Trifolium medium]|nr:hypothetical protein [Trifolium medium]